MSAPRRRCAVVRAALLLEVVVALTVLVAVLGLLGAQLVNGLKMLRIARERFRATQLIERPLMKLDLNDLDVEQFLADRQAQGDFGAPYPGWFWRARAEETDVPGLWLVTVEILHQPNPELADEIDSATVVHTVRLLKAQPVRVSLVRDFGMTPQQAQLLAEALPVDFDPNNLNPAEVALAIDPETLQSAIGPVLGAIAALAPPAGRPQPPPGVNPVAFGGTRATQNQPAAPLAVGGRNAEPNMPGGAGGGRAAGSAGARGGSLSNLDGLVRQFLPDATDQQIAAISELIRTQIGDQLSPQQINALLGLVGPMLQANGGQLPPGLVPPDVLNQLGGLGPMPQPGGGQGGRGPRGSAGGRAPLTIQELNRLRNDRNQRGNP